MGNITPHDMTFDLQQGRLRLTGKNVSECLNWSVKISINVSLRLRRVTVLCPPNCHLFNFKTQPQLSSISDSKGETFNTFGILLVYMSHVNINIIKQDFLLTNIQIFTRNSELYLKRDYHRMLCNSKSCLETENQSFSSSLSHGGLVWS